VVAFVVTFLVTVLPMVGVVRYMKRRPPDASLTWGEAMAAATFAFFILFMAYGVVPHQWLTWADNELNWRPDRLFLGPGEVFTKILPFELTYQVVRDVVVSAIYGGFLVAHIALWAAWQNRGKRKPKDRPELETSPFGRPLVKLARKA
jgi:amino acid transporter